jgi:hypothetical protein
MYYSTNGGDEWLLAQGSIGKIIYGLTILDSLMFACTESRGILRSTDKGLTWSQFNIDFPLMDIMTIINNPKTEHIFISCLNDGIYRSTNLGASWHEVNSGLPPITSTGKRLSINPKTGMLFLGFGYDGVYRSTQDNIPIEEPEEIPTTYSLSQNYPNPFNPTTKIQYSIPEASYVRLSVYNGMGQEMMQLVNENQSAGKYIVDLNAQNLPSGVYFYRLQTGKFVDTKKMLLIK